MYSTFVNCFLPLTFIVIPSQFVVCIGTVPLSYVFLHFKSLQVANIKIRTSRFPLRNFVRSSPSELNRKSATRSHSDPQFHSEPWITPSYIIISAPRPQLSGTIVAFARSYRLYMLGVSTIYPPDANPTAESRSLAILFIVENSQAVLDVWPDLQQQYLLYLTAKLQTNTTDSIRYFLMESSTDQQFPQEYHSIHDAWSQLRFDPSPKNRLSFNRVWSGVDSFACATFPPHVSRHIVIVAASPPLEDNASVRPVSLAPWQRLAKQLAQASVKCHMILSPSQNMAPFIALFEESLALQGGFEDQFPFPVDSNQIVIKLTGSSSSSSSTNLELQGDADDGSGMPTTHSFPQRRNNSFPSDLYLMNQRMQNSGEGFSQHVYGSLEPTPSLVSQLQQVHGLTKKKVYSAKPIRQPFFKEERFSQETNDSLSLLPLTNSGGRAPTLSRVDRAARMAQAGSPTDAYPRRPGVPRRNSRMSSSPDLPNASSPMSYPPSNSSPTSPTSATYPTHSMIPPSPQAPMDPSWLSHPYSNSQNGYPYPSYGAVHSPSGPPSTLSNVAPTSHRVNTGPAYHHPPNSAGQPSSPPANAVTSASSTRPAHRRSLCPEDDEPFTFDASYVAATVELWENEVLPAYPDVPSMRPSAPAIKAKTKVGLPRAQSSRNTFSLTNDVDEVSGTMLSDTPYGTSHDIYATGHLANATPLHFPGSANNLYPTHINAYPSGWSSSLTGWAG